MVNLIHILSNDAFTLTVTEAETDDTGFYGSVHTAEHRFPLGSVFLLSLWVSVTVSVNEPYFFDHLLDAWFLQHLEEVRKILEACSVDKDIAEFVNLKKTGSEKPGKTEYETISDLCIFSSSIQRLKIVVVVNMH